MNGGSRDLDEVLQRDAGDVSIRLDSQCHRAAGHVRSASLERAGVADRGAFRRSLRRGGRVALAGRRARAESSMGLPLAVRRRRALIRRPPERVRQGSSRLGGVRWSARHYPHTLFMLLAVSSEPAGEREDAECLALGSVAPRCSDARFDHTARRLGTSPPPRADRFPPRGRRRGSRRIRRRRCHGRRPPCIREAVRERKGKLLHRVRAASPDVVAAEVQRRPRGSLSQQYSIVSTTSPPRNRRIDERASRDVLLEHVVLSDATRSSIASAPTRDLRPRSVAVPGCRGRAGVSAGERWR